MRVLITGSNGQIGTNLALRLLDEGHSVFGVDKRVNTWTDRFRYLLQDLSNNYPAYEKGIGGVEYPEVDLVVHLAAHAKVHELVRQPHRAMENVTMTYNVLEYCRLARLPKPRTQPSRIHDCGRSQCDDGGTCRRATGRRLETGDARGDNTRRPHRCQPIAGPAIPRHRREE